MTKQIRSLPPGVDSIDQDVVFGTMWIKVGTLKLIRTSNAAFNVLCQFWGETSPSVLTTRFDTPNNQQQRTQRYNIKCPITFFIDYLQQMKNNLRLDVEGVGKVSLDVSKFIKKNVTIDSRQAFDNFKGFFQVIGKGNRKAGSLEIQMGCDFDPTIALKQLGESGIQQIRKSEVLNCPAQKLQVKMCCGHCQCVCPKPPPRVKVINKKQNIKQDDTRIAHSLDTKPRQDSSFDANKYRSEKEEKMQIENIRKQIINKEQQKTIGAQIKKQNKQAQVKRQDKQKNEEIKKLEQFPEVPKILTYSNLRLNYEDEELNKHLQSQKEESIIERKWSDNFLEKSDPNNQIPLKKTFSNQSRQNREQDLGNKHKPKISPIEESDPLFQIKAKPEISKQALLQQFYGPNSSPFKFHEQARQKSGENFMRYNDKSEQDKLSRVINLNEELNFNKIGPPPLLTDSNEVRILPPDPNFRRTPFVTNTEQAFFADPPFINDGRLRTKTKGTRSKLMLSLFIEIIKNSVTLPIKEPFIIAYRPYGKKERLTLGPNFGDKIQILNIVGENEIRKMGKTPFIVEFWSSSQNKFLGLIRIDLNKIKQGFLLQDQLNQMAIKTNILPTTILKGKTGIHDLSDNEIGDCMLYCAIGTQNQLNTYLNQKQNTSLPINTPKSGENSKKIEDPEKQEQKQNNVIEDKNIASNYDTLLEQLYRNNSRLIDNLNRLMNQQFVTRAEMSELANNIGFGSIQSIYQLHRSVENDQSQSSTVDFHRIADSFDDYIEVLQIIRQQFTNCSKAIRNLFQDPNSVCSQLRQSSPTQIIPKKKAIQLYKRQTRFHEPIEDYFGKLNQYINIEILCANLQGRVLDTPELSQLSRDYFNNVVNRRIFQKIGANAMKVFDRIQQSNQNKSVIGLKKIYGAFQGKISLWLLLHLFEVVNKKNKMGSGDTVIFDQLKEHWIQFQNLRIQNQQIKKKPSKPEEQKVPSPRQPSPRPLPQHEPYQQQQQKPQPQIIQQKQPHKQPEKPEQPQIEPKPKPQPNQQPEQIEQPQQPRLFKHLFSIQPSELSLDHPLRGNCVVVYEFPFEEEQVKSKTFATAVDKHKYGLKMYGTHGFTIQEDVRNYIGDNGLKFYVIIDKKVQFEGALPSDELLIEANTEEDKIIPLFCDRTQGIAGKIKLNINYEKAAASENMLGKETTYQLFLPKSGHLNYSIICQHQQSKIRSQLNLKQQFYVALVLDMFHSNPNLRSQFPPISSKLYADSSQSIQLAGSIKLSLNPVILQYIKSANSRLTLNVIYYSKDSGNFERKQLPFASIQLPLINVIKAEGIKGEYAFKNKLGMFVTLANCRLKYDKDAIHKFGIKQTSNDKLSTSFWLILNFLQFMNFDVHRFTWIKMQFVIKSKKYSTQKLQLQPYSINFLHNAAILIKLTQQQFVDTKIIPVTIITNNSQKLAIDINLKSFSKDLIHRKYSIHNQTYIVVNQASKATKMRIAMKSYCFRGGPLIGNFVNSLYQHLDTEVIQDQMPEHTQNYEQMLDIFKNNLKLTQKGLQQALSQLDLIRNKQKLNFEFFTNRTYYKLDYTPILAQSEADIDFICEQLPTEADKQQVIQYLNQNNIRLQNFRPQFLDRFSFRQLNRSRADKNVEFLGIQNYVDLISFVRKIKLLGQQQNSNLHNQTSMQEKLVEMTILEGINFQQLYNGIKPNSLIRIPDLGIQTQVSHRNSNPYFNEIINVELDKENITMLRNLKFQVYHCTADDDDAENILIGEGYLNLNIQQLKQSGKILKLTIGSVMSHKMKANLNIKVALVDGKHTKSRFGRSKLDESSQRVEDSADVSRFGEIIQDIKHEMAYKNKLFESSDQD